MPELHSIETWMMSVITDPRSVAAGANAPAARSSIGVTGETLNQVVRDTAAWPATERLEVYRNAYFARLTECLREDYPILKLTLGDEMFDHFVLDYLKAYPPTNYTLGVLGARLSVYLQESRPPRDPGTSEPDWADFLVELAELEWLITEVFDGPGHERAPAAMDPFRASSAGNGDLRVECSPSLRLCRFRFPVRSYYSSWKSGDKVPLPQPAGTFVALVRQNFRVRHIDLSSTEFNLLNRLQAGHSLAESLEAMEQGDTVCAGELNEAWIANCFTQWTHAGVITRVTSAD